MGVQAPVYVERFLSDNRFSAEIEQKIFNRIAWGSSLSSTNTIVAPHIRGRADLCRCGLTKNGKPTMILLSHWITLRSRRRCSGRKGQRKGQLRFCHRPELLDSCLESMDYNTTGNQLCPISSLRSRLKDSPATNSESQNR